MLWLTYQPTTTCQSERGIQALFYSLTLNVKKTDRNSACLWQPLPLVPTFPYSWAGDEVRDVMHGLWSTSYLLASAVGKQSVTGNLPRFASPHNLIISSQIVDDLLSAASYMSLGKIGNWLPNWTWPHAMPTVWNRRSLFPLGIDRTVWCGSASMPEHPTEGLTHSHALRWNFCSARLQKSGLYLDWEIGDSLTIM